MTMPRAKIGLVNRRAAPAAELVEEPGPGRPARSMADARLSPRGRWGGPRGEPTPGPDCRPDVAPQLFADTRRGAAAVLGVLWRRTIRNANTRMAYVTAAYRFADWCAGRGMTPLGPGPSRLHVASYIEQLDPCLFAVHGQAKSGRPCASSSTGWLSARSCASNPAASVRGPKQVITTGKTPGVDGGRGPAPCSIVSTPSNTHRAEGPGVNGPDGVWLCARERPRWRCAWRTITPRAGGPTSGCGRRAASTWSFPRIMWRRPVHG